jgi:hypothetical protein
LRELAKRAGVDPGYASRLVDFLDREALVTRTTRGPITSVDWQGLLRRWSASTIRYAVTGSWAAAQFAPVAPPRLLLVYVDRLTPAEKELDVRPAEAGANVALLTPFDDVVFERTSEKAGVTIAAVSQIAADLLTSPGRGPNEAEALMKWMSDNEDVWRA